MGNRDQNTRGQEISASERAERGEMFSFHPEILAAAAPPPRRTRSTPRRRAPQHGSPERSDGATGRDGLSG